jgi:hypothetical protein
MAHHAETAGQNLTTIDEINHNENDGVIPVQIKSPAKPQCDTPWATVFAGHRNKN